MGNTIKLVKDEITYKQQNEFDYEMYSFVKRKYNLPIYMEIAFCIFLDQCSETLQDAR